MHRCRGVLAIVPALALAAHAALAAETLVRTQQEYGEAVRSARPGDTIILADGEWRDFEIVFAAEGLPNKPITLTAETKGKVVIAGRSNLRIAGEHLVVSGLVFRDGYTPTNDVIAFRRTKQHLANHSRVTEVVIDRFNNPERHETDFWVMMYGKGNRFDHSMLIGKSNTGVTMAVRLDTEASQNNGHRIDHNYFGPRPILGSNGGETLRIGTSKYSLTESRTLVERNYFERCNGEVEIVSSKSGSNVFRGNVFVESRGTLTLRHGNDNRVEDNVFLGNGVPHTGGIRVINKRQTIRNNYLFQVTGRRFAGALVVMNGVPDSPINRYHQVEDAVIENNTIIGSDHIELAAGSDDERSAVPKATRFRNNLIANLETKDSIAVHDDISGIHFAGNVYDGVAKVPDADGFEHRRVEFERGGNGLAYPVDAINAGVGIPRDLVVVQRDETGPRWYPKPAPDIRFGSGRTLAIGPGQDSLTEALEASSAGDVIELETGEYTVTKIPVLAHPVTVRGKGGNESAEARPLVRFERSALVELADGGSLELVGLAIDGSLAPDAYGNSVVRTSRYSMLGNYAVRAVDCEVANLNTNHSFNFLLVSRHTFARSIDILRSSFRAVTGHIVALDREIDDLGIYNGESVVVEDSRFADVEGAVLNVYRGGTDESTFGPEVSFRRNVLEDIGHGKRNKTLASVFLHGVQTVSIEDNDLSGSQPIRVVETVGEPITRIDGNRFSESAPPVVVPWQP
ncbi:MAG: alginate lyase [Gammaproteobacteria bacterium]|nr:alginate lyase [Gammaproteobacteria bacterium]MYF27753.1 alginate lyase [Gammaproteobacteria bacterium]MYK45622.1 alginate lyase [Gammaproteobacteria bacterium]